MSDSDVEMLDEASVDGFQVVPNDVVYEMQFQPLGSKKKGIKYTLKKGQSLPYTTNLSGIL